eukprot:scaffold1542_cov49-Attheya_sp.AAC.4
MPIPLVQRAARPLLACCRCCDERVNCTTVGYVGHRRTLPPAFSALVGSQTASVPVWLIF